MKHKNSSNLEVPVVRLPKLGPIHPGLYITILGLLAVALIIFLIGFLPGLLRGGKRVTFNSPTASSAVYVDGTYLGKAPVTAFIPSGTHNVRFSFRDEFSEEFDFTVSHPLFFTWLFPRRQAVEATLLPNNAAEQELFLQFMLDEVSAWSAVLDFDERYHFPPRMSDAAHTLALVPPTQLAPAVIGGYFASALLYITSETLLADAKAALAILTDHQILTVAHQESLERDLVQIALLFQENTPPITDHPVVVSATFGTHETLIEGISGYRYPADSVVIGAPRETSYPAVVELAQKTTVPSIAMAEMETTEYQWARFMEANPLWAKENKVELMELGLVDYNYLQGIYPSTLLPSQRPIRNISYYAALAYCQWLSEESGQTVRLPTASEWEYVAQRLSNRRFSTQLNTLTYADEPAALFGSVWELTSTPFVPLERYLQRPPAFLPTESAHIVKGGSYLTPAASIDSATVGVQEAIHCSNSTGFRVVW